jgi:hypothetical protein
MNSDSSSPVSKDEALASLAEIQRVVVQTRRTLASGAAAPILILWGLIWIVGFADTQFHPDGAGRVWTFLNTGGIAATFALRLWRRSVKSPVSNLVLASWCVLMGYGALWIVLVAPWMLPGMGGMSVPPWGMRIPAFCCTAVMCGYVIMGLWLSRFYVWLGLGVTAATVIGYYALPHWFSLWMAIFGGGALLAAGLFTRRCWR